MTNKRIPKKAKRLFDYNPKIGIPYWRERPLFDFKTKGSWKRWNTMFAGKEAGYINPLGYRMIVIDNVQYLAHRIIAFIMKGWNDTNMEIDHKNGNPLDNRWSNLRPATHSENSHNTKLYFNNTSGYKGVCFDRSGKWRSYIKIKGKRKHLGYFDTAYEAHLAYEKASKELHGRFRRKI